MAFGKRSVSLVPLMVAHERETGLFQAEYAAENRYREPEDVRILSRYHDRAKREQREALQRVTDELNATFKRGDLVSMTFLGGDNSILTVTATFDYVSSWWLHTDGVGHPLVSMLRVEDANERYIQEA